MREWIDQGGADMIIGGTNSAAQLAGSKVATEKKRPYMVVGAATSRLTNEDCSPYIVHYAYDTIALANGTGAAVVKAGGKSWFFLTADYAFGHSLEKDTADVVKAAGGTVVGAVRAPLNASDFSSFLLQAQNSKAQILGLANAGGDTINSIKAANEFGVTKTMKLAGLLMFINDIHALGLKTTQGMYLTDGWYWNQSPEARAWSRRFFEKFKRMPSMLQAGDYSATLTYLTGGQGGGHRRPGRGDGADEEDEDQRHVRQGRVHPSRWSHGPRHVSAAGQDARGVEGAVGLLQDRAGHSGRSGVQAAWRVEVSAEVA